MNTQQTLAGYRNTADFVGELSKHFKIVKTCKNDDLMSCFEDKVIWGNEEVDMTNVKNASHFGQDDWDTDIIGVQFANGTTGLIAYNPSCTEKPFTNQYSGTDCLAILYDTDGLKNPNTQMKDLNSINVNSLGGNNCAIELSDGTCFTAPMAFEALTKTECEDLKNDLNIANCYWSRDYWAGAVKACGGVSKLPSSSQLTKLAEELYKTTVSASSYTYATRDNDLAISMQFITNERDSFSLWAKEEDSEFGAYSRSFYSEYTNGSNQGRANGIDLVICISD